MECSTAPLDLSQLCSAECPSAARTGWSPFKKPDGCLRIILSAGLWVLTSFSLQWHSTCAANRPADLLCRCTADLSLGLKSLLSTDGISRGADLINRLPCRASSLTIRRLIRCCSSSKGVCPCSPQTPSQLQAGPTWAKAGIKFMTF